MTTLRYAGHFSPLIWAPPIVSLAFVLLLGESHAWLAGAAYVVLLIACVLAAVHCAELVALWLGEPYGTLVLTLAVTVIELALIISLMLSGPENTGLVRDAVNATVMLTVNGIAGACILLGTLFHREQEFRTLGANAFLAVLIPMATIVLVLPNHTHATPGPTYSDLQQIFVGVACFVLYLVFLFVQTVRHREYFLPPDTTELDLVAAPSRLVGWISVGLLILALAAIILLAEVLAPFIEQGITAAGAPTRLAGVVVAMIVLTPESIAALRAACRDHLQTSINLALGSALACIGLTVPSVLLIATSLHRPLELGVDAETTVLLALSFGVAMLNYGQGRANLLSGCVHIVLLASWVFLIFAP